MFTNKEIDYLNRHKSDLKSQYLNGNIQDDEDYLYVVAIPTLQRKIFENKDFLNKILIDYKPDNISDKPIDEQEKIEIINFITNKNITNILKYHYLIKKHFEHINETFDFINDLKLINTILYSYGKTDDILTSMYTSMYSLIKVLLEQFKIACQNHKDTIKVIHKFTFDSSNLKFENFLILENLSENDPITDDILKTFNIVIETNKTFMNDIN